MKVPATLLSAMCLVMAAGVSPSAEAPPPKLEEIPAALEQMNKDLAAKLDNVSKLVDAEATAGRLSEPAAQTLRWTLQTAISAGGRLQLRTLISSARLPTDNAKVMAALTELEAANTAAQTRRSRLSTDATREMQTRLAALLKSAVKPGECEAFEHVVEALRPVFQTDSGYTQNPATSVVVGVSQRLGRLLAAEAKGEPEQVAGAILSLQASGNSYNPAGVNVAAEIDDRAQRTIKPLNETFAAAQRALEESIIADQPVAEIEAALARYSQASRGYVASRSQALQGGGIDPRQDAVAYDYVVAAIKGAQSGEDPETLRATIQQARQYLTAMKREGIEKVRAVLDSLEKKAAVRVEKATAERLAGVQSRLSAVTKPEAIDAIAVDLAAWSREPRSRGNQEGMEMWAPLAAEIGALAALWASPVGAWPEERFRENQVRQPALAGALREVRRRIEREVLSRQLRAPELKAAPLNALETEAAIEALADQLTAKGDWRRLLALAEGRMQAQAARGRPPQDDAVAALRSFFAAQNLELAEQWAEAAQAYREVLRSPSTRAPVAAAAEKLKALVKAHPEAHPAPLSPGATPGR